MVDFTNAFPLLDTHNVGDYVITIRAFSITRFLWIKDYLPLAELLELLASEGYISSNLRFIYYSMIRDAAQLLAHRVRFTSAARTREVRKQKVLFDLKQILSPTKRRQLREQETKDGTDEAAKEPSKNTLQPERKLDSVPGRIEAKRQSDREAMFPILFRSVNGFMNLYSNKQKYSQHQITIDKSV